MKDTATFKKTLAAKSAARLFDEEQQAGHQDWYERKHQSDPEFAEEVEGMCSILADLQALESDVEVVGWMEFDASPAKASVNRKRWRWSFAAAAALLITGVLQFTHWQTNSAAKPDIYRYTTNVGEIKEVTLSDGSRLTLNTGTLLLVDMSGEQRRVIIERGEVFFDVESDPARPFSVGVGDRSVTVLGTEFGVRKQPDGFVLAVTEGVVAVHRSDEQVSTEALDVAPGQTDGTSQQRRVPAGWLVEFDLADQHIVAQADVDLQRKTSWQRGILHFANEPLSNVIYELNRYSGKKIMIDSAELMNKPINASLRVDSIYTALLGLEKSYAFKVTHHFDHVVISEK